MKFVFILSCHWVVRQLDRHEIGTLTNTETYKRQKWQGSQLRQRRQNKHGINKYQIVDKASAWYFCELFSISRYVEVSYINSFDLCMAYIEHQCALILVLTLEADETNILDTSNEKTTLKHLVYTCVYFLISKNKIILIWDPAQKYCVALSTLTSIII